MSHSVEVNRRRDGRRLDSVLLETVRESVLANSGPVTPSTVAAAVQASGRLLGTAGALEAAESINAELNGLGPLQPLAQDPAVTDIFVNGPDSVWLDRGNGLERSSVRFDTEQQIRSLATRLVSAGGRRLDDGSPCVDVRLKGGYRVHAVLAPISTAGTLLSVRIRRDEVFTLSELRKSGMFSEHVESVLRAVMANKLSFLISGATGSGKTTLLSTMLGLSHPTERLVLIEDAAELNPVHPHVVTLESRHGNLEGGGALDLGELVRQALRMRPDRLIVGECRGAEVRELLTALNTGHTGGGGTIHANTAEAVPARLVALGALAGLNAEAVRLQVSSALDVVIHVDRTASGRKVASIGVVTDTREGQKVLAALSWRPTGMEPGPAWPGLSARLSLDPWATEVGQVQVHAGRSQQSGPAEPEESAPLAGSPRRRARMISSLPPTGSGHLGMHRAVDGP
ncbi:TadA family conjugal transfer-associated ATPase [Paenarthrobacter aurescens]|uniref:TadA family conjugal transfer-associated ATPase n=1 Tax=Paenarthrobacter aurescens TaxID=43663 RepID=UPI001FE50863|nr:TadA family conjugal transfer-associated ATPase [Paenarthrobacter aurescens]MDO6144723.1 TadA family conjugal transfer-associated ATPase [Paenarthrobacter aurescens]MDO6148567.1 TadA family conjugal transfer-associated ATPase [Paenarthrobacter aurescens]MDO6159814.1 TadA family conjugal transfer-associated ATPase [Paenarthrobacter aurescens]MDO6163677.1 TadA family conjugal transfer-associated ATPase [Paenarthrobacter aurescens]